jgi:S-adenosylmethionine hydrolase
MKRHGRLLLMMLIAGLCRADVVANSLVVLFTDYGADSIYVGALKGAIYAKFPLARIDTLTNSVPPFDVATGAYLLAEACREFPKGAVFCCVVDPGVGTDRKRIVLETKTGHRFVGPDNGLFTLVARRFGIAELREATNQKLWREGEVSHTFQGRDVFGPVAAALASGVPLAEVGPELKDLVRLPLEESRVEGDTVRGTVVRSDGYGNLVTNITAKDLEKVGLQKNDRLDLTIGKARFTAPLKSTYADVPEGRAVILVQSSGYLECAINLRNLADEIHEGAHAPVTLRKAK